MYNSANLPAQMEVVRKATQNFSLCNQEQHSCSSKSNILIPSGDYDIKGVAELMSVNQYPLPDASTISVSSAGGMSAAPTVVYLLNNASLNDIDDNGSGAASITYSYQDGFGGKLLSDIIGGDRAKRGAICYGFSIRMNVTSGGAGDPANLALTNPFFETFNTFGRSNSLDVASTFGQGRSDFDSSIMVWRCYQNFGNFVQFGFTMPVADTATVTLYWTPNF